MDFHSLILELLNYFSFLGFDSHSFVFGLQTMFQFFSFFMYLSCYCPSIFCVQRWIYVLIVLSVSLLDDDELGAASTIQVVAYKNGCCSVWREHIFLCCARLKYWEKCCFASTTGLVTDVMGPSFSVFCCMGLTALVLSSLKWSPLRKSERFCRYSKASYMNSMSSNGSHFTHHRHLIVVSHQNLIGHRLKLILNPST
ncbi:unnamed protein product [Lepeophtheirus salmonis]|uniref:(salmon louse) hypothetical protein n=1 Tax=Lepeophtheirus salmonis TaxID=72036 RepID=A0A7R8CMB9_LEPSM|nr:unnamed protein product [Lepeophtheirus salmonis]CAF2865374.1 unnamed protein product [Lepeophtheirus salmonis]